MKELEVYVHIPFCVSKCNYCDFLSIPASENIQNAYVDQLLLEIRAAGLAYKNNFVTSVFIGGGTPSVLPAAQMQRIWNQLNDSFYIRRNAEMTIECNPGTMDARKLEVYQQAGVNRLSIGLQSADPKELRLLGRIHTFEQFLQNYELAREFGFDNINIDIISSLPGQKIDTYEQTLRKVTALKPEHISAYSLMIEEGTPFFERYGQAEVLRQKGNKQSQLPSEEEERQMYELTKKLLKQSGYERYEISNYALPGHACRHNTGYWLRKNYIGIGLGASSCVENIRFSNITDLNEYLKLDISDFSCLCSVREELSISAQMEEFMFLGLRMMCGVSAKKFQKQFSYPIEEVYGHVINKQLKEKLIRKTLEGYCLTEYGIDVSNYVMSEYIFDG